MANPIPLQQGQYYHIHNRGNNRERVFIEERNYRYFLKLYAEHIEPIADTFAYCLLPNHFHFLVYIKDLTGLGDLSGLKKPSQYFSNLFNAYTKALNKAYDRTGALFQRPFGRILVTSDAYFVHLVTYIHQNPQRHGLVADFRTWPYSSYHAHLSDKPTRLQRDDVLAWFDGPEGFTMAHSYPADTHLLAPLVVEDFD
jgi:REP element-mobilizing transposase RayT